MNTLHSLFSWIVDTSLRASLLAGAVLCFQAAMRGHLSARWRYAMWLPVLFVLVAPVLPESRWSAEAWLASKESATIIASEPVADVVPMEFTPMMETSASPSVAVPVSLAPDSIDWQQVIAWVWAAGAALVITGGLGFYLTEMRRCRRSAVAVSPWLQALMQEVAHDLKLRRVPDVWMSPRVASPAVAGLWRPVVLLPVDFESAFTEAEAALVLRHELMHLKRWDLPLNALFCVLQALHWFNPLLWFVAARVRHDREAACDAQVLASSSRDCRIDYGLALLKVQATCQPHGFCLGLVGMFGDHAAVKSRIAAIARFERAHPLKGLLAAAAILGLGALGATRAEAPSFHIGASEFAKGDAIHITSVNRSDALIAVSGDYELASQDEAVLAFHITATDKDHAQTKPDRQQRMSVKKGKGPFTLVYPNPHAGLPHVSFYPIKGGKVLGGIYFGTKEEAEASKKRNAEAAEKPQAQALTPLPDIRPVVVSADAAEFDPDHGRIAYIGQVKLTHPQFTISADDRIEVTIKDTKASASGQAKETYSQIDKAIATGKLVTVSYHDSKGRAYEGSGQHLSYDAEKGTLTLKGWPTVSDGKNVIAATAASTMMIVDVKGRFTVKGPAQTKLLPEQPTPASSAKAKPAASVNGQVILDTELPEVISSEAYRHRDKPLPKAELRRRAVDQLIDRQLVLAEFKKIGGSIKPEYVADDIESIIKTQFKGDRDALVQQLAKQGITMEKFREMREKMTIVQIMRSKFGGKPEPATPAEVEAYYKAHADRFTGKTEVKISTITLPKNTDASKKLADELHAKLSAGADFAALAKAHSQDSRASHGGSWDVMELKAISPAFQGPARTTKVGQLAPVIEDKSSLIILRVDERTGGELRPLDSVKAEIEKAIKAERSAVEVEKWLAGLRAKADIKRFE
ncbi:MAG: peptidyl-prolyl cis-trans isomerase [Verrucomicrobiaceae bacterium]|nr:peptidyl-prolyl cis-trans isomerase [Verrucomicrobiaceae bacterium]